MGLGQTQVARVVVADLGAEGRLVRCGGLAVVLLVRVLDGIAVVTLRVSLPTECQQRRNDQVR